MTIDLQPIDDATWLGFQGAISWPDGQRPLFASGVFPKNKMDWNLVLSPEGAAFVVYNQRMEEEYYDLDVDGFDTPEEARAWVAEHFLLADFE